MFFANDFFIDLLSVLRDLGAQHGANMHHKSIKKQLINWWKIASIVDWFVDEWIECQTDQQTDWDVHFKTLCCTTRAWGSQLVNALRDFLCNWLIDWLIDWQTDWMPDWFTWHAYDMWCLHLQTVPCACKIKLICWLQNSGHWNIVFVAEPQRIRLF